VFVGPDFTALLSSDAQHLNADVYPADVMSSTLDPSTRKALSNLDVQILAATYETAAGSSTSDSSQTASAALHGTVASSPVADSGDRDIPTGTVGIFSVDENNFADRRVAVLSTDENYPGRLLTLLNNATPGELQNSGINVVLADSIEQYPNDDDEKFGSADRFGTAESRDLDATLQSDISQVGELDSLFAAWQGPLVD